mmetsp:Transcript_77420/g.221715  ORF Transcript_77420/g.221715 Transcript_77420/m.221715 type:complete len:216 (-) Transcript_77420:26-673(-)
MALQGSTEEPARVGHAALRPTWCRAALRGRPQRGSAPVLGRARAEHRVAAAKGKRDLRRPEGRQVPRRRDGQGLVGLGRQHDPGQGSARPRARLWRGGAARPALGLFGAWAVSGAGCQGRREGVSEEVGRAGAGAKAASTNGCCASPGLIPARQHALEDRPDEGRHRRRWRQARRVLRRRRAPPATDAGRTHSFATAAARAPSRSLIHLDVHRLC